MAQTKNKTDVKLTQALLVEIKEFHSVIAALSSIQSSLQWPQTDMIEKAKAALADRFLKDNFNLEPIQVQPDEKNRT